MKHKLEETYFKSMEWTESPEYSCLSEEAMGEYG